jgi:uncharacterized delta-60 repeat protein
MRELSLGRVALIAPLLLSFGVGCAGATENDDEMIVSPLASSVAPAAANPPGGGGGTTDPCIYVPGPPGFGPGPGDADPYFGCLGTASYGATNLDYQIRGLAIQSDDKIIAVGSVFSQMSNNNDVWVARFTAAGKLDTTFGNGGFYTKNFTAPFGGGESAEAAVVQPDGHIVIAGGFQNENAIDKAGFLIRLDANGVPDPGFGTGGSVLLTGKTTWVRAIALQPNDQLAIAGENCPGNATTCVATMGRFDGISGAPDLVFAPGTGGIASTMFGASPAAHANALAVANLDDVVIAGDTHPNASGTDIGVMKFNGNIVDTSFGTNGVKTYDSLSNETAYGIAVGPGGGWVVAESSPFSASFVVRRLNYNGVQNTTYGTNGRAFASFAGTGAASYAIMYASNALTIVAGVANTASGKSRMAVARFTGTGALDTAFSDDGQATFSASADTAWATAMARQSNGKLIVAGWSRQAAPGSKKRAALVRVLY